MDSPRQTEALPLDVAEQRPPVWCKDCGTRLTSATSRREQRGRRCKEKHGDRTAPRTDAHHIDQDAIPGT